jgi:hypothetical protein
VVIHRWILNMDNPEKDKHDKAANEPLTDAKPTGRPTDDRFNTETAHHDLADPNASEKSED